MNNKFLKIAATVLLVYSVLVTFAYKGRKAKHMETLKQIEIEKLVEERVDGTLGR